jgi:hypothetical protein
MEEMKFHELQKFYAWSAEFFSVTSSLVVFVMFPVVFVALHNASHRFPYGDDFISCYNVISLFLVWAHLHGIFEGSSFKGVLR